MRVSFRADWDCAVLSMLLLTYPHVRIPDGFDLCSRQTDKNVREMTVQEPVSVFGGLEGYAVVCDT